MAAAGPAPRGCSRAGARPFQYGAAANNTSAPTQRKQHWRRTALAPAAPRLAARAADAHRGPRSAARPHGKRSPLGEPVRDCACRRALSSRLLRGRAVPAILGAFLRSRDLPDILGAFLRSRDHSRDPWGIPASQRPRDSSPGAAFGPPESPGRDHSAASQADGKGKLGASRISLEAFACPLLF